MQRLADQFCSQLPLQSSLSTTLQPVSDLFNGGYGLIIIGSYSRLLNDAKDSPITAIKGSAHQWFGAVGVGYVLIGLGLLGWRIPKANGINVTTPPDPPTIRLIPGEPDDRLRGRF